MTVARLVDIAPTMDYRLEQADDQPEQSEQSVQPT